MRRPKPFRPRNDAHDRKVLFARRLRRNATEAELHLWEALKDCQLGYHFAFQFPLCGYIVDFYCRARSLAIEVDGGYHDSAEQRKADAKREDNITRMRQDVRFLRFSNGQVLSARSWVVQQIRKELGLL
jgi:leucyl-tRNA synthetase